MEMSFFPPPRHGGKETSVEERKNEGAEGKMAQQ